MRILRDKKEFNFKEKRSTKKWKECIHCDDLNNLGEGVWIIKIFKRYNGTYGKRDGPLCHDCLANALTGYHTGGGLVGSAIKKIKRCK